MSSSLNHHHNRDNILVLVVDCHLGLTLRAYFDRLRVIASQRIPGSNIDYFFIN